MKFTEFLKDNIVYLDGAMGSLLMQKGLMPGEQPELWNITKPEVITAVHKQYFDAGSNVVCTNTFGANTFKFSTGELELIIARAIENAKRAKEQSDSTQPKFVALDIGPSGKMLKPLGDLDFEDAVEAFATTVRLGAKYGADLIIIETMNDSYETKAAVLAAKENSELPIIVSNAYGEDQKLMTGASPEAMVALLEGMGADAIGANCSLGPSQLKPVIKRMLAVASVPVIIKPNAGLPRMDDGKTVYDVSPCEFALEIKDLIQSGVRVAGGCCGTCPEYIKELCIQTANIMPLPIQQKHITAVSSYTHAVHFGTSPILIGERINPTGKKRLKQALKEKDIDYILSEGIKQQEKGVHILDVNVGMPEIDEVQMLRDVVYELQSVIDLPLQIDTSDAVAMEAAIRRYNGKAMINSVCGKAESMDAVFPIVKKYGGVVVALTLDENGIPQTAEGRLDIAKRILSRAKEYGIDKKDIVFDTLAMTVSADKDAARTSILALKRIRDELGVHTSLGVSNVSFGLPARDAINGVFFTMALENGLSAAIMNPFSVQMMSAYYSYRALCGLDDNFEEYIKESEGFITAPSAAGVGASQSTNVETISSELSHAIIKGLKERAAELTSVMLENTPALEIVNSEIIPALNIVGTGFENKTVYLPQLLMSAEAAKSAFEIIKSRMQKNESEHKKGVFVLATVKGDIHDIGKNIVKLILENYGYRVIDLGKDVEPETVASAAIENGADIVGLSALMTTTVPAMEQTVQLLRQKAPQCRIIVGGAVLTKEYADKMGADKYAKDAMEAVRYAQSVLN